MFFLKTFGWIYTFGWMQVTQFWFFPLKQQKLEFWCVSRNKSMTSDIVNSQSGLHHMCKQIRYDLEICQCVCSLSRLVRYSLAVWVVRHWKCRSLLHMSSFYQGLTSFFSILKCKLFLSIHLLSSHTEGACVMNTLTLFHTTRLYLTLPEHYIQFYLAYCAPLKSIPRTIWAKTTIPHK